MADTTTIKKLMGIFNNYIADSTATNFSTYCTAHSYTTTDGNLNTTDINSLADAEHLTFAGASDATISSKLEEIIRFVYDHNSQIASPAQDMNMFLREIVTYLNANGKHLALSNEEANKIIDAIPTSISINDITVPKTKRRSAWLAKKVGIPTLITAGVCGAVAALIGASGAVVGALPFLTDSLILNIATLGTLGVVAGAIVTPIVIVAKNAITRAYYKNKYGRKSDSLKMLLESGALTHEDLKSLNLDIVKLMDLIKETDDKLIRYKTEDANPIKKGWRKFKSYFMRKTNRNRMHELVAFTKMLEGKADSAETESERKKYKLLYDYIDNFWGNNIVDNYSKLRKHAADKGKADKKIKVQNLDIITKASMKKADKKRTSLLLNRAKNLVQRAILRNLLTGNAGVLNHDFRLSDSYAPAPAAPVATPVTPAATPITPSTPATPVATPVTHEPSYETGGDTSDTGGDTSETWKDSWLRLITGKRLSEDESFSGDTEDAAAADAPSAEETSVADDPDLLDIAKAVEEGGDAARDSLIGDMVGRTHDAEDSHLRGDAEPAETDEATHDGYTPREIDPIFEDTDPEWFEDTFDEDTFGSFIFDEKTPAEDRAPTEDKDKAEEPAPAGDTAEDSDKKDKAPTEKLPPLIADRKALLDMEAIMLNTLEKTNMDVLTTATGCDEKTLEKFKKALEKSQDTRQPLAKKLRRMKSLGENSEELYQTISALAKDKAIESKADALYAMVEASLRH
ncbi:MAG TPA: hypothetical protein IAC46_03405 [Candidatus Onthoplasma faecigallinarum]|nr:hypothetical protein [Candidatus Onthoplasma faecigallinarum]